MDGPVSFVQVGGLPVDDLDSGLTSWHFLVVLGSCVESRGDWETLNVIGALNRPIVSPSCQEVQVVISLELLATCRNHSIGGVLKLEDNLL